MPTIDLRIAGTGTTLKGFHVAAEGGKLYRIVEVPTVLLGDIGYMDLVELEPSDDGVFELKRVVASGGWRRIDAVVSRSVAESEGLARLLARVQSAGGMSVRDFGGCLSILLPPGATWDPSAELAAIGAA